MITSNDQVVYNNIASLTIVACVIFDAQSKVGVRHFLQEDIVQYNKTPSKRLYIPSKLWYIVLASLKLDKNA